MTEITLEKIDIIKERTGVSYTDAKEALEECNGDVVNALIYIEAKEQKKYPKFNMDEMYTTKDEFMAWIKDALRKGNVTRVKIRKDETVVVDIPVNAGIAAGIFALIYPALIGIGVLTAVLTKVTIEITKEDGTVEVVNTIIKNTVDEVKERFNDTKDNFNKNSKSNKNSKEDITEDNVYQYTVKFEEKEKNELEKKEMAEKEEDKKEEK